MNRMNESKDNGQLQNKHASSKPKESEKGDACTLGCCFFLCETSRESGRGEAGLVTGRPCRHRGLPPPPPPPSPSNTMDRRRLTLYAPMMPSSFRFVLSAPSFPAWRFGCLRRRQRNRKHRKYCPQDRKPTWEMSSPKRISLPPWEPRGFLQRRDRSPNECTSGAFFECKGTHYDRWQNC